MSGTYDFIQDLMETIKEQGFQYCFIILQPQKTHQYKVEIFPHLDDEGAVALEKVLMDIVKQIQNPKPKKDITKKPRKKDSNNDNK